LLEAYKNKINHDPEAVTNGKPTCLIVTAASDCFWARCSPDMEYFKRTYGEQINFLWINVRLWDFMIQIDNPYANQPEKELYGPVETLEERARTVKALYLRQPWLSIDCKLDLPSDICANLFQVPGGEAQTFLLDPANRLVWRSVDSWEHWNKIRPPAPWGTDNVSWADEVEQQIQSLLLTRSNKNNQKSFPAVPREQKNIADVSYKAYLLPSKVVAIDRTNKTIKIKGRPSARFSVILHDPDTYDECNPMLDITLHCQENSLLFCNKPYPLKDLQIGDILGGWIKRKDDKPWGCSAVNLTKKTTDNSEKETIQQKEAIIHSFGELIAYDCKARTIKIQLKNLNEKSLGGKFIQDNPEAYDLPYATQIYLDYFANRQEPLNLKVNEHSLLRRNGIPCQINDFEANDSVRVEFIFKEKSNEYILRLMRGHV